MAQERGEITIVNVNDLHIMIQSYFSEEESDRIFEQLETITFNSDKESEVIIYGKKVKVPRKQVAFGDEGVSYKFAHSTVSAKPWPQFLLSIRDEMEKYLIDHNIIPNLNKRLNYVLVNYYSDGNDYIGFHSDDEEDLIKINDETIVVSLSFGVTREFLFSHKYQCLKHKLYLDHGDLLIMRGKTQQYWKHSLPKRPRVNLSRYNLTFRFMKAKATD